MGFLQDNLIPIFKKRELTFIERVKESDNVYTFAFEKGNDVTWKAGQYGLFSITHKKIKNATKPFSIISAPAENAIKITTVIRDKPSDFKKALLELQPGMKVSMSGPLGPFYLQENRPTLLIAGGIGITPFRAMLKQREADGARGSKELHLLYMDSQGTHLFKEELDRMSAANASLRVTYLGARDELRQEIERYTAVHSDGQYYVAGPKAMVDDIAADLRHKGVSKRQITKDGFFGY